MCKYKHNYKAVCTPGTTDVYEASSCMLAISLGCVMLALQSVFSATLCTTMLVYIVYVPAVAGHRRWYGLLVPPDRAEPGAHCV